MARRPGGTRRLSSKRERGRTVLSPTEAGRQVVHSKRSARTQQLAKALTDGFTPGELETLLAAAPLIERLGKSIG